MQFGREVGLGGNTRELVHQEAADAAGVESGAAGGEDYLVQVFDLVLGEADVLKSHGLVGTAEASGEAGADGVRLLVDFLVHELLVPALLGRVGGPWDRVNLALNGVKIEVGNLHAVAGDAADFIVVDDIHFVGLGPNGAHVAGDVVFAVTEADNQRAEAAHCDHLVRAVGADDAKGKRALQFLDGGAHGGAQVAVIMLGDEVGHGFSVGLALELDAAGLKVGAQFLIILKDAVVDDGDAVVGAEVRVRVADRRLAMSCPAGVADADGAI